ncbi:MAG: membrane protein insertase YidC [Chthoniobacterales bacterium]
MDRKAWVAITLSVLGIIGWYWYVSTYYKPPPEAVVAQAPSPTPTATVASSPASAPAAAISSTTSIVASEDKLFTSSAEYVFQNDTGGIEQIHLYRHKGENGENVTLNEKEALPIGTLGFGTDEPLKGFEMHSDAQSAEVVFQTTTKDGIQITKRFHLPESGEQYLLAYELTFKNTGSSEVTFPAFFVSAGRAAPIHDLDLSTYTRFDWLEDKKSMTDIDVNWFSAKSIPLIGYQTSVEKSLYTITHEKIAWASVSSQYFCTIINSAQADGTSVWAKRFVAHMKNTKPVYGMEGGLGFSPIRLAAGETAVRKFTIYSGPKDYSILEKLGEKQQEIMKFGFFKPVSIFLLWAMNKFYSVLGSYAWSIILLTLCIKSVLWYPQNKATQSMRRMSLLSPKMTELRAKYKDDPTKMNEELMKLYREYNVNPLGGCLPMLIQIPIFFGFYGMLGTAIELRNSSFLWVRDLSQPDTVFHIYGFPINVLPLVMAASMLGQMLLTPKTGDATQQRFVFFMPVIYIAFSYNYASGLSLYWTTQNIFSIVQLYLTRNQAMPTLQKKSDVVKKLALEEKKKRKQRKL